MVTKLAFWDISIDHIKEDPHPFLLFLHRAHEVTIYALADGYITLRFNLTVEALERLEVDAKMVGLIIHKGK